MKRLLSCALLFLSIHALFGQITVVNHSQKTFTNLYILPYDSAFKTTSICEYIIGKNLLKKSLKNNQTIKLASRLKPKQPYKLVATDTSMFPPTYSVLATKFYFQGNLSTVTIDSTDLDMDFKNHCLDELATSDNQDLNLSIHHPKEGNIIKLYFKFYENEPFTRCMFLFPWNPIKSKSIKNLILYNSKPKNAERIYIQCFTEWKGIISEQVIIEKLEKGQKELMITL